MRILLTGAGGPSAISVWKSLNAAHTLFMADMDPCATGLYLVPPEQRLLVPRGDDPSFVDAALRFCQSQHIDIMISTVDAELVPLAQARHQFEQAGTQLPVASLAALRLCRDKLALLDHLRDQVPTPQYEVIGPGWTAQDQVFPRFAKPRVSAGSRNAMLISHPDQLQALPQDGSFLLQEWLPGDEYSVDVYITADDRALASVPRLRMKTDSGIAMAARTVHDPELEQLALEVARAVGVRYVANVQFKRDRQGQARLLEINPRFPGTLPLTTQAGVDIPALLLAELNGQALPAGLLPFTDTMVVRYLCEQYIAPQEWSDLCAR